MWPPAKRQRAAGGDEVATALAWLNSYPKVSRWMERYDIPQMVEQSGGIVLVRDFLPPYVAEGALCILQGLPASRWNDTAAQEDYTHNNIAHRFWSVKAAAAVGGGDGLQALLRAFTLLVPNQFNAFSAARYERGHHIAPHDDRAYTPVQLETGEVVSCSRDLTCLYYLTKGWEESMGGALVDLEDTSPAAAAGAAAATAAAGDGGESAAAAPAGPRRRRGRTYVPQFNSAVFFRVPRYHTVTPLTTDRPRYSVFGWYLQPGKLYELYTGKGEEQEEQRQAQAAAADVAAAEQQRHQQQQQQRQERKGKQKRQKGASRQPEDTPAGAPQCRLAQRLLANLAAEEQQGQGQPQLVTEG